MSADRSPRVPAYRRHKQSGQAVVTLPDGLGGRRDVLLGTYRSAASKREYERVVAEWLESGRRLPGPQDGLTVNELLLAYWKHAETYYDLKRKDGFAYCLKDALRVVKDLYGPTAAKDFGPLALKACRRKMVEMGWSRGYVNAQVNRVRRAFRWAAGEQLVPGSLCQDLEAVDGLRKGKSEARETAKVRPVAKDRVEATVPFMPPAVQAMVRLQELTACRPAEVCVLRPLDLDMGNPKCWVYRPGSDRGQHGEHKTAHHGHDRLILIGPKAQEILKPWLGTKLDAYCFCPAEGEVRRSAERRDNRKTKLWPSHEKHLAKKRKRRRARSPGDRYDTHSYRRAIHRACDQAFPPPEHLRPRVKADGKRESLEEFKARLTAEEKAELVAWRKSHRWAPNRLRHSRGTELRKHGLDVAKTILGHSKVETTEIYAEKDLAAAMELVARIG